MASRSDGQANSSAVLIKPSPRTRETGSAPVGWAMANIKNTLMLNSRHVVKQKLEAVK